jgi:methionyl aminopeptidase
MHKLYTEPNNTPLKSGDVISVDCGAYKMDIMEIMHSFEIGESDPETKIITSYQRILLGIREFKAGNRVEDVGNAIQKNTESFGYGVVRGVQI